MKTGVAVTARDMQKVQTEVGQWFDRTHAGAKRCVLEGEEAGKEGAGGNDDGGK